MTAEQASLFDADEAARRRDAAIDQVDAGADPEWKDIALEFVYKLCLDKFEFVAEETWERGLDKPREPRALGPVMKRAVALGYCMPTDRFTASRAVTQHKNQIRIYESRLSNMKLPFRKKEILYTEIEVSKLAVAIRDLVRANPDAIVTPVRDSDGKVTGYVAESWQGR